MPATPSRSDLAFRDAFEAGRVPPAAFDHRAHLRLAFVHVSEGGPEAASRRMGRALRRFLAANGAPASKYHETLTRAWTAAVAHFASKARPAPSFEALLAQDDRLLDPAIMLTHYRRGTLFSDAARARFVPPDLQPIPEAA